jgi:hypothetical protein
MSEYEVYAEQPEVVEETMETYNLEQYRHIPPIVYECAERLLEQIRANNDIITFHQWKTLVKTLQYSYISITNAFSMFMTAVSQMPNYEEYVVSINNMFTKYERNDIHKN